MTKIRFLKLKRKEIFNQKKSAENFPLNWTKRKKILRDYSFKFLTKTYKWNEDFQYKREKKETYTLKVLNLSIRAFFFKEDNFLQLITVEVYWMSEYFSNSDNFMNKVRKLTKDNKFFHWKKINIESKHFFLWNQHFYLALKHQSPLLYI